MINRGGVGRVCAAVVLGGEGVKVDQGVGCWWRGCCELGIG